MPAICRQLWSVANLGRSWKSSGYGDMMPLGPSRRQVALSAKGFMPEAEGDALHRAAEEATVAVPNSAMVEVGSYCGRSTVWLGDVAERHATVLFAVDHHHGSEENQAGWEHHDPDLVDPTSGRMDTLADFRSTIERADLEHSVVAVIGESATVARWWHTPLCFVFIDGGHGVELARADYLGWARHVVIGGTLAIHDVFRDPADGGQAPYEQIYRPAIESDEFVEVSATGSLRVLRRVSPVSDGS